eukprot:Colp12_sorted_trinity150504_noHs@3315
MTTIRHLLMLPVGAGLGALATLYNQHRQEVKAPKTEFHQEFHHHHYVDDDEFPTIKDLKSKSPSLYEIEAQSIRTHFTHGVLRGKGKLESVRLFHNKAEDRVHAVVRLGEDLTGHPGIVHGGLIATIFDEIFGGTAWMKSGPVFTAYLTINYRKPVPAGTVLMFTGNVKEIKGRKVFIDGTAVDKNGEAYADANALFVVPRDKAMQKESPHYQIDHPNENK